MMKAYLYRITVRKGEHPMSRAQRLESECKTLYVVAPNLSKALAAVAAKYVDPWVVTSIDIEDDEEILFAD